MFSQLYVFSFVTYILRLTWVLYKTDHFFNIRPSGFLIMRQSKVSDIINEKRAEFYIRTLMLSNDETLLFLIIYISVISRSLGSLGWPIAVGVSLCASKVVCRLFIFFLWTNRQNTIQIWFEHHLWSKETRNYKMHDPLPRRME